MTEQQLQQQPQQQRRHHQGVLWKRRDVFKNKWRPRWFVLQPEEAVLTYYLLSRTNAAASSTISTPLRPIVRSSSSHSNAAIGSTIATANNASGAVRGSATEPRRTSSTGNNANNTFSGSFPTAGALTPAPNNNYNVNHSIHSTVSEITTDQRSTASENPIDYDVVPRGAIYLVGCHVQANDALSLPHEGLFAFTIAPSGQRRNADENLCHLAARTEEARAAWVAQLVIISAAAVVPTTTQDNNTAVDDSGGGGGEEGADTNGGNDISSSSSWKSLTPPQTLFDNVPSPLAAKIEQTLESYLELCDDSAMMSHYWAPIFEDRDGVSAYTRQDLHGRTMMKSTAIIPHHPKQVMSLLLDSGRRQSFEANVAHSERLEVLNAFCFLDYYAYKAVWPTSPRDFAVAVHWQALQRFRSGRREEALVTLAFSCPEADDLKDATSPHVRANLHASFYLLRLVPAAAAAAATGSDDLVPTAKCHVTRILSYDLGGSLPRNLANTVLMQQAGLPGILSKHLRRVEPTPDPRLSTNDGPMTNEGVIKDVLEPILQQDDTALVSSARRRLNFDKSAQEKVSGIGSRSATSDGEGLSASLQREQSTKLSMPSTAVILLVPLLLHRLSTTSGLPLLSEIFGLWVIHPSILFCVAAFSAVRYVVKCSLGRNIPLPAPHQITLEQQTKGGPTTCRFAVDLKGVLRFIGMKREEKKERAASSSQAEISVVHIVAIALANAMQNHSACWNYRRVKLPWLLIDGYYRYPSTKLSVLVSLVSGRFLTLENFQCNNVQAVANVLSATESQNDTEQQQRSSWMLKISQSVSNLFNLTGGQPRHGRCLVVLTKTDSENDNQTSSSSDAPGVEITQCQLPDDVDALVVVGGIRLHRNNKAATGSPKRALPPKPILSLTLSINTASVLDVAKCNAFAEEVKKLVQFPELCDG